jgi:hypothetical protein
MVYAGGTNADLNRPLIMNDAHQFPLVFVFFKNQAKALPVHPFIFRIKSRKVVFNNNGIWKGRYIINFYNVWVCFGNYDFIINLA